jgi:Flp pilus assembly pilin Flp
LGSVTRFFTGQQGASVLEYALVTGLIAIAAVGALKGINTNLSELFSNVSDNLARINP